MVALNNLKHGVAFVTLRDIQRMGRSMLRAKERIEECLIALTETDCLVKTRVETIGRPTCHYIPNPKAMGMK
jgi:hypothetical protein